MDIIGIHAESNPKKPALIEGSRSITYAELFDVRNRVANALLDMGLRSPQRGQHAIVWSLNSIEYLICSSAVRALGGIAIPMNHRLGAEEVTYILDNSDAVAVFVGDDFIGLADEVRGKAPKVRDWVSIGTAHPSWTRPLDELIASGSDDPSTAAAGLTEGLGGSMFYTAGTTGNPKGARRSTGDAQVALGWLQTFDLDDAGHVHLIAGPLYHSAPAAFTGFAQLAGNTCVIMRKFDPEEALRLIQDHRCSSTFMAPTLIKRIIDLPKEVKASYDVSSMKVIVCGGAPCPMRVKEEALSYFGPVLYEFYGSTELGINTILRPEDLLTKPGSCGRIPPGMELAVFDDNGNQVPTGTPGDLHVRRYASVFDEYYKNPDATRQSAKGEWLSVGDIAYIDEDGYVYICDRKRDMIISGGVNIYPAEIEEVLHRDPRIKDAGVFGVPDDEWGERIHAAVELYPEEQMTEEEVKSLVRSHLAGYKVPREVTFHDSLPRDTAGKLVKRVLRDPYWEDRATKV